jgi:hypothetical protein
LEVSHIENYACFGVVIDTFRDKDHGRVKVEIDI